MADASTKRAAGTAVSAAEPERHAADQGQSSTARLEAFHTAHGRRPVVLHITGDYPDEVREPTTQAVKALIDGTVDVDHVIISLKRLADPRKAYLVRCSPPAANQKLFAVGHHGLPFGVGLGAMFDAVAKTIARILRDEDFHVDLIHAHRLTFDGLAGERLATQLGVPLFLSVRGEVERKVLRYKPTYRPRLARLTARAARVYLVSAWYGAELERFTGFKAAQAQLLPNIVRNARTPIEPQPPEDAFVIAANLDIARKKGIARLIKAFAIAGEALGETRLDVFGAGTDASRAQLQALIARLNLEDRVTLKGAVSNDAFLARLPRYLALALPSRNETFGMVYTEALFAGVPILYGRSTGIDGYLSGLHVGIGVNPSDMKEISQGLCALKRDNEALRRRISSASEELMSRFDGAVTLQRYRNDLAEALHVHARGAGELKP
ncbi:MAG: glycosyltransferase family 4 protein [Pseudomonadota bacterium]